MTDEQLVQLSSDRATAYISTFPQSERQRLIALYAAAHGLKADLWSKTIDTLERNRREAAAATPRSAQSAGELWYLDESQSGVTATRGDILALARVLQQGWIGRGFAIGLGIFALNLVLLVIFWVLIGNSLARLI